MKYLMMFLTHLKAAMAYRADTLLSALFSFFRVLICYLLWRMLIPEGGTLDIGARLLPADDDGTTWYELSVADSGTGIADDIMPHIFEPFFTTHRQAGRAAGLGLSVATGLVHGRGGQITAANRPEGGALFRLLLPLPVSESRSEGNE